MREVVEMARAAYGTCEVRYDENSEGPHESGWLALDVTKARTMLGVRPKLTLAQTINQTMAWYRAQRGGADALHICQSDIAAYEALC